MLFFISKHSSVLLIVATFTGLLWPEASLAVFPALPYVLFFLMLFTLIGIEQKTLLKVLNKKSCWIYTLLHSVVMTVISCSLAILFNASDSLLVAIAAVSATGSLFATPAIARSIGLNALTAMAMTIATTLLMPVVLYINLLIFQHDEFSLDMTSYLIRLIVFIVCPMACSALVYHFVPRPTLTRVHNKLSQFTILLVFAFPFGLVGPLRDAFNSNPSHAINYIFISFCVCFLFFISSLLFYLRQGKDIALLAAITSSNRNVLLTFTVAGASLGPDFLILLGALQIPTYALPLFVRLINNYITTRHLSPQTDNTK
ncbi:hypothetical protein [Photobacterium lutimaris]|uniref:Bile acid:sodium symporter n=1 Tax=Photobacterium lutimaris TaxID=388278 RepID=A0A2T3J414_9GAMM|nr:hypothetical protein [Photobacterium lutimaris]PSU36041.1 hypothetical protein C9I99_03250 [Photobacterium lutimaris]TDR79138.1 BASS family bile acid:Na+ symporter [Photobacterium lutimaris]